MVSASSLSDSALSDKGETVGVWLDVALLRVFRKHVGPTRGAASKWGKAAFEEKLRREGAFEAKQESLLAAAMKKVSPEAAPLLVAFVELLETRGTAAMRLKLEQLTVETAEAEKVGV